MDLVIYGQEYTNVTGIKATDDNGVTQTFVSGGGGGYDVAGGTVILASSEYTIFVDVDFEPTHAIIFADYTNWAYTSWTQWGAIVFDTSFPYYMGIQARISSGNFQYNPGNRDISNISYVGGKFKFYDTNFKFQAGVTYTWYAWRERT